MSEYKRGMRGTAIMGWDCNCDNCGVIMPLTDEMKDYTCECGAKYKSYFLYGDEELPCWYSADGTKPVLDIDVKDIMKPLKMKYDPKGELDD